MSFFAIAFAIFLPAALIVYYLMPGRFQWLVLLAGSLVFYAWGGLTGMLSLLLAALVTYGTGWLLGHMNERNKALSKEERAASAVSFRRRKRLVLALDLILLFGFLYTVKYWNATAEILERLSGGRVQGLELSLVMPIGLSFYLFQSAGYAVDCYRGKYPPEKNFLKLLLFVCFFPQMVQGPISRQHELGPQLTAPHRWDPDSVKYGLQRMLWGYMKKMIIADRAAVVVSTVFGDLSAYGGFFTAFAVLFYCIELYFDFSGGIDITIGAAQLFGITMPENFRRPIWATSLSDYWRRWHITLGTWMRDYIFYPLSMSKPFGRLGHFARQHIRGKAGKVIPTALATFIVYLIIGIWHGANFRYIAYGLWNGTLMTSSVLLANFYYETKKKLHIDDTARWYHCFQILRTLLLVFIGRYITISPRLLTAAALLKKTVVSPCLYQLRDGTILNLGLSIADYGIVAAGTAILLFVEWRQEKGIEIRKSLERRPAAVQFLCLFLPLLALLFLGILKGSAIQAQFIYQQY